MALFVSDDDFKKLKKTLGGINFRIKNLELNSGNGGGTGGVAGSVAFKTVSDLRASNYYATSNTNSLDVSIAGYNTLGDGGNGEFYWNSASVANDDGVGIFKPNSVSGSGRWMRVNTGIITARQAGIMPDGTDIASRLSTVLALSNVNKIIFDEKDYTLSGTVVVPGDKVIAFENGARIIGTGTLNGGIIECNFKKQCFGTSLTVINLSSTIVSVMWFGAKPDYRTGLGSWTDNQPLFDKAVKSFTETYDGANFAYGNIRLYIPSTKKNGVGDPFMYRFNSTLNIQVGLEIYGDGMERTWLYWGGGIKGLYFMHHQPSQIGARYARVHDFTLMAGAPYTFNNLNAHGIHMSAGESVFERIEVLNFSGSGFYIEGTNGNNVNNCRFDTCRASSCNANGFDIFGSDANNITFTLCNAIYNGKWGFKESSFLGNTFIGCHTDSNGRANSYNLTAVTWNPGYGGTGTAGWNHYYCIKDCGPGTSAGIVEPGITPGWQTYWEYVSPITDIGAGGVYYDSDLPNLFTGSWKKWNNSTNWTTGGGYLSDSANTTAVFLSCYAETGAQHMVTNSGKAQYIGGFASVNGTVVGSQAMLGKTMTVSDWQSLNPAENFPLANTSWMIDHSQPGSALKFVDSTNNRSAGWFGTADGGLGFSYSATGSNLTQLFAMPTSAQYYADRIGRPSLPSTGAMEFPLGVWFGKDQFVTNCRYVGTGTAAPTTGTWADSDFILNVSISNHTTIGWKCTSAGTPGTWVAISGGSYTLPIASSSVLGGIKVGSGLAIDGSGVLSVTGGGITVQDDVTNYGTATTIKFTGAGKTVSFASGVATIDIPSGSGGGLTNPMTTLGDIIAGAAAGAPSRIAGNITTTKKFLTQTGDGANSAAPSWGVLASADIPSGSTNYIQNQFASAQSSTSMWISGNIRTEGNFLTGSGQSSFGNGALYTYIINNSSNASSGFKFFVNSGASLGLQVDKNLDVFVPGELQIGSTTAISTNTIFNVVSTTKASIPFPVMTTAQRNAISTPIAGMSVFCSDCTASDASTGVSQTYNGSTWKNYW